MSPGSESRLSLFAQCQSCPAPAERRVQEELCRVEPKLPCHQVKKLWQQSSARRGSVENVQTFAGLQLDRHVIDVGRFDDD